MRIAHRRIKTDKPSISIPLIADAHRGSKAADKELFAEVLKYIAADKSRLAIVLGDLFESILPSDKRFDLQLFDFDWHGLMADSSDFIRDFRDIITDRVTEEFRPIAKQVITMNLGNHEFTSVVMRGVMQEVAHRLKILYGGWTSQVKLIFEHKKKKSVKDRMIIIQAEHGYSAPRTKGGLAAGVSRRLGEFPRPDVIVWGHAHQLMMVSAPDIGANSDTDGDNIDGFDSRLRWGVVCPAMVDSYKLQHITYAERRQYPPAVKGVVELNIDLWKYKHPLIIPRLAILRMVGE